MAIGPSNNVNHSRRAGFTLVELILVMAIMMIILGIVAPSLKGFFRGRNLDNEAMRFLALTHYGQSRAVNEGVPVELWVNSKAGTYGLEALSGYAETATTPETYTVDSTIQIAMSQPSSIMVHSNYWSQPKPQSSSIQRIRFQPDGFISDASPANIYLRQAAGQIWIAEAPTHLEYEIQTGQPAGR